jgi:hypothetical protein
MRPSTQSIARVALCVATGVPLSLFLFFRVDTDKDRLREEELREEVAHLIEEYDDLDDEALDDLLTEFIVRPYPTQEAQDS